MTPQNVPFATVPRRQNIAFTSLWDNWPHSVKFPWASRPRRHGC